MKKLPFFFILILIQLFTACEESQLTEELPEMKTLNSLGRFSISIDKDQITLAPEHEKITDPLLYQDDISNFNFNSLYRITNSRGEEGYFRFGWIEYKDSNTILSNINWFYRKPPITWGFETFKVEIVETRATQKGSVKICTIGDSQTWWGKSASLRKEMDKIYPNFYFVGSNTDIYGYPHEGEGGNSTKSVLARIDKIPSSDVFTLLIGTNDWKNDPSESLENIIQILEFLSTKYPSARIIYLGPLPTTDQKRDEFNKKLELSLIDHIKEKPQIIYFPLGERMRENKNWEKLYLAEDGLHPNINGVEFMAKEITIFTKKLLD